MVAYPQNPDAALKAIGMTPENLRKTILVQFVGEDRQALRSHSDLSVSVDKLRNALRWLSVNSWLFMEATKQHELWESGMLDANFEALLQMYEKSVGCRTGGVPVELIENATRIAPEHAPVFGAGPADCTADQESNNGKDSCQNNG